MKVWTQNLTTPLVITAAMGIQCFSFKVVGNGATYSGNASLYNGTVALPSQTVELDDGDSEFITAGPGSFLDGVTITPGGALIKMRVYFQ